MTLSSFQFSSLMTSLQVDPFNGSNPLPFRIETSADDRSVSMSILASSMPLGVHVIPQLLSIWNLTRATILLSFKPRKIVLSFRFLGA